MFLPKFALHEQQANEDTQLLKNLFRGLSEIVKDKVKLSTTIISSIINMLITPLLTLILPNMVESMGGQVINLGLMTMFFGVGSLVASIFYVWRGDRMSPLPSLILSFLVLILSFLFLSQNNGDVDFIFLLLIGASIGYMGPFEQNLMQSRSSFDVIGRVMLAYSALRTILVPVGYIILGQTIDLGGSSLALSTTAIILLFPLLILIFNAVTSRTAWRVAGMAVSAELTESDN